MNRRAAQIQAELRLLFRDRTFPGLILLLFFLMAFAAWNTYDHLAEKEAEIETQLQLVRQNDQTLIAQIDSLKMGLATYDKEYTLPTSGVRLSYNNHRITWIPLKEFALVAIGQSDLYSNYKKIVLYFNDSYERRSQELESPVEQLFGQLDLAFVWTYLLPLVVLLSSFDVLSIERETGRLRLIASQPIQLSKWLLIKISIRFFTLFALLMIFTLTLLSGFGVSIFRQSGAFTQLTTELFLYSAFWFVLSFLVNRLGFNSGRSLILLTNLWVLFVFLIPAAVNQLGTELHPVPSRLEIVNHHQMVYNEIEHNLGAEMEALFRTHPDWSSDDPVTKDMSNSTGWNINFLAKQYIAQLKHQPKTQAYEDQIDARNNWFGQFRIFSPAMLFQSALTDLAGTSTRYYRSFLQQAQAYAQVYRQYVFKGLFTNHAFTSDEIRDLPAFEFDSRSLPSLFWKNAVGLFAYLLLMGLVTMLLASRNSLVVPSH